VSETRGTEHFGLICFAGRKSRRVERLGKIKKRGGIRRSKEKRGNAFERVYSERFLKRLGETMMLGELKEVSR
jgi:hypothetical protein